MLADFGAAPDWTRPIPTSDNTDPSTPDQNQLPAVSCSPHDYDVNNTTQYWMMITHSS